MPLTYIDTGVLLWAWRGEEELAKRAFAILDDDTRTFASGDFVKLETLPQATYHGNTDEVSFYEDFFASCDTFVDASKDLCDKALEEACAHAIAAVDSLHIVSAEQAEADELVTTEGPTKPIHRTTRVTVVSIKP